MKFTEKQLSIVCCHGACLPPLTENSPHWNALFFSSLTTISQFLIRTISQATKHSHLQNRSYQTCTFIFEGTFIVGYQDGSNKLCINTVRTKCWYCLTELFLLNPGQYSFAYGKLSFRAVLEGQIGYPNS